MGVVRINENVCVACGKSIPEGRMICYDCENEETTNSIATFTINLNKVIDVASFANLVSKCSDDVVVKSGNFAVNAKSTMGLLSLDLTKPVKVEFYGNIPYEVEEGMKKFIVN